MHDSPVKVTVFLVLFFIVDFTVWKVTPTPKVAAVRL